MLTQVGSVPLPVSWSLVMMMRETCLLQRVFTWSQYALLLFSLLWRPAPQPILSFRIPLHLCPGAMFVTKEIPAKAFVGLCWSDVVRLRGRLRNVVARYVSCRLHRLRKLTVRSS